MLGLKAARALKRAPDDISEGPVRIRIGEPKDARAWINLRERSRDHLTRWEPDWRADEITLEAVRSRLKKASRRRRKPSHLSLFIFRETDQALVGGMTLSSIRFHVACSAQVGYWIGSDHVGNGYAKAALRAAARYCFDYLELNRLEAACQPGNIASQRVLTGVGFHEEGFARDYLFINGAWRDHCLFALTARDAKALGLSRKERPERISMLDAVGRRSPPDQRVSDPAGVGVADTEQVM